MSATSRHSDWLGIVCDAHGLTMLAVRGERAPFTLRSSRHASFDVNELVAGGRLAAIEAFVAQHDLGGCRVAVAYTGVGTIVQSLGLPRLNARHRRQAIRTGLLGYATGRELTFDARSTGFDGAVERVVAAGVERALSAAVFKACRMAGLGACTMTALATAVPAPSTEESAVQLLLGARTTTIQIFDRGRLLGCRDVLLGVEDFVTAYQRPILTDAGPVTLSATEAAKLARSVGVPVGREDEIHPGVRATQMWPTLTPVLQKLTQEVEQTIARQARQPRKPGLLRVLGIAPVPGLDAYLRDELHVPCTPPEQADTPLLRALHDAHDTTRHLDLRPPEVRRSERLLRPAWLVAACAVLVIGINAPRPQTLHAQQLQLAPVKASLEVRLAEAQDERTRLTFACAKLAGQLRNHQELAAALPPDVPVDGALREALGSVPADVELAYVQFDNKPEGAVVTLRGTYRGDAPASVVASQWARHLADGAHFADARVTIVTGSGRHLPALMEIRAELKGGP